MQCEEKLLTIIVPIYNVELYLEQCLNSLVNQTVTNFKVILVDDGSKDGSGIIAKRYAEKYPEMFQYIFKENAGLGAARNTGMEYCDTEYVEFLDSDDWLLPRTVEKVIERIKKEADAPDIIFMTPVIYNMASCKYEHWYDNELLRKIFSKDIVTCPQQNPEMYSLEANVNRCVWNYAFLKRHAFLFPEGVKWEDVAPHFYIFYWARRCIMVEDAGFCYRINSGSQITSSSDKGRLDVVTVFSKALVYAFENSWGTTEVAHIIKMLISFSRWSMAVSKREVLSIFVKQLHLLFSAIPDKYIKAFEKELHPSKQEKMVLTILRSPAYIAMENYHFVELGLGMYSKVSRLGRRRK